MIRCKNVKCQVPLGAFEIKKLENTKNSQQSKYRFCIKCRTKFGRNRNINIESKCSDCGGLIIINHWVNHKCRSCVLLTSKLRVKRNRDKNKKQVVFTHKKIEDMITRSAPDFVDKGDIIKTFGLSEDSFKQHMRLVKKHIKITRKISYGLES